MKYIKTYESFNYQVNEEFLGIGKKLKEYIDIAKKVSQGVISKMSDEERMEALNYMEDKGMTPELAQQTADKLNIEDSSEETADTITEVVPEVVEGENSSYEYINEGIGDVIKDRLIRFVGNPMLSGFLIWISSIIFKATAIGWASQPQWIIDIHDALAAYNLQGPVSLIIWIITFVVCILTIVKMVHGRSMEA